MLRSIKALGLSVLAVVAGGATSAAVAQAGELELGVSPAVLTAHNEENQQHVFLIENKNKELFAAKCTTGTFEGTTQGQKINEFTVTPTYGTGKGNPAELQSCTFGGIKAQVLMNGCKYTFTGAAQPANTYLNDIVGCTAGKSIEIKAPLAACTIDIPEQNALAHQITKQLTPQEVTLEATVEKIKTLQTGAGCPDGNNFEGINAALLGNTIVTAYKDSEVKVVTLHQHQYSEHRCGTQVTITAK